MSLRRFITETLPFAVKQTASRFRNPFPERQILIRDTSAVRSLTLRSSHQWVVALIFGGCLAWAGGATIALLDSKADTLLREHELARRAAELDAMRGDYHQAMSRLDEFDSLFGTISCEIGSIQGSLLRIAEHSVAPGNKLPQLEVRTAECAQPAQGKVTTASAAGSPVAPPADPRRISGAMPPLSDGEAMKAHVNKLSEDLENLRASHGAFLQQSASIAQVRIGMLEKTLAKVGVDAKTLVRPDGKPEAKQERYGQGGPYIAPPAGQTANSALPASLPKDDFSPMALFNNHASRLDNLNSAMRGLPLAAPLVDYELTSPFGARNDPINAMTGIHEGVDLGAPMGTPVLSTGDGVVVSAGWRDRYGNLVEIQHSMGIRTRYAHLSKVLVRPGDKVTIGKPIGLLGTTGRSTGPHLHYEVRVGDDPTNPMKFITAGRDVLKVQ